MSPRSYKLSISRLQLNITEWGDPGGPPLVLQHGGRDHGRSWDAVAMAFADDYRVIVPDLRGHGDSEWVNDGAYDILGFVEDFTGIVRALDLPPCKIVGHSLGGNITTRFTGLFPDRVTKLVNIEGLGESPEQLAREAARDPIERMRGWIDQHLDLTHRVPRTYPDEATLAAKLSTKAMQLSPEQAAHLARHAARANPDGSLTLKHDPGFRANLLHDFAAQVKGKLWAEITCPVLLIYGADSWASNPEKDGRATHFRDVRLETFDRAGHWVHHDRRDDFIAMVKSFLG